MLFSKQVVYSEVNAIVRHRPWRKINPPKRILAIRFQALGDTLITLPYLQDLKKSLPDTTLHFLTRQEVGSIPKELSFIDRVITIGGKRNAKLQFVLALFKIPYLLLQRYDVILDLQNNRISKAIRMLLRPVSWSEFDKSSPISAGERTRQTINATKICEVNLATEFALRRKNNVQFFTNNGILSNYNLVVLNPAGYCSSRNWPLDYYITFAKLWLENINPHTYFLLLLLPNLEHKAKYIKEALNDACIDLTGKANQVEAFEILQRCKLVLTEDSGLMHMAWIQGIPTVALFSSSRKDWSAPQGKWSLCFDSSDLECGPCMLEICKFGDNRCLTRLTPEFVMKHIQILLKEA